MPIIIFCVVNVKFYCFLSELLLLKKTILCNCSLVHFLFRYCPVFHFEVVFCHYKQSSVMQANVFPEQFNVCNN